MSWSKKNTLYSRANGQHDDDESIIQTDKMHCVLGLFDASLYNRTKQKG